MRDWKLPIFLAIVVLGVLGAVYDTTIPPQEAGQPAGKTVSISGAKAPSVVFTSSEGKPLALDALKGKVVLLNFWASWCEPCAREFPIFLQLLKEYPDKLVLVAVSVDEDKANIPRFIATNTPAGLKPAAGQFYLMWDKDKKLSQEVFETVQLPETIIITPDGTMVRKLVGADKALLNGEMKEYLRGLMGE